MVIGYSPIVDSQFSQLSCFLWNMICRQHTNISANPQSFFSWDSITVKSAAIKEDKVSCLGIDLDTTQLFH
jgi:hypothetical protein